MVKTVLMTCIVTALSITSYGAIGSPSSSTAYLDNGATNHHHSYHFEQSTHILLSDDWDVRYTDDRFRSFLVQYSSFKHQPRWSEIYDDWGERYGVAVIADMRKKVMILTWADEFKISGLHYIQSGVKHEAERYQWNELMALTTEQKIRFDLKAEERRAKENEAQAQRYQDELALAKADVIRKSEIKEAQRDQVLLSAVKNTEKSYMRKLNQLEDDYQLKLLELTELKAIQKAQYEMDTQALQSFFDNKVSKQNAQYVQSMLDLEAEYQIARKEVELDKKSLNTLKENLNTQLTKLKADRKANIASEEKYNKLVDVYETERTYLATQTQQLKEKELALDQKFTAKFRDIESEIVSRTAELNKEVDDLKINLAKSTDERFKELEAEHAEKLLVLSRRENDLDSREVLLNKVQKRYFPNIERTLIAGAGESTTRAFLMDNWQYDLDWNTRFISEHISEALAFPNNLNFVGSSLEDDIKKIICQLGGNTKHIAISAKIYPTDHLVSLRFDKVDEVERNKFMQLCSK